MPRAREEESGVSVEKDLVSEYKKLSSEELSGLRISQGKT
jgi:hypothetical protein